MIRRVERLWRYVIVTCLLAVLVPKVLPADMKVKVEILRLPENAEVEISASATGGLKATKASLDGRSDVVKADTKNQKFRVYVDLSTISNWKDAYYLYDAYVVNLGKANQAPTGYRLQADPIGVFDDGWREINFEIADGQDNDTGTLRIPIHSFSYKSTLLAENSLESVHEIKLARQSLVHIRLQNTLGDMGISIDPKAEISSEQTGYWTALEVSPSFGRSVVHIQKNATEGAFDVILRPNSFQALTASLPPLRDGQSHSEIVVSVNYHVDYGGSDRRIEFRVPVRFVPSIWSLFLIVTVGACLGTLLCGLLPGQSSKPIRAATMISGVGLSLIAEVIGMILVSNNSKLILLGLELNPFQLLTAFMIGVLCGAVIVWRGDAIQELFNRLIKKQEG